MNSVPLNKRDHPQPDCIVVGASFSGLACATALAQAGLRVRVLEKKGDPGDKLHTTGIIVKDAIEQLTLLADLPGNLVHRIDGVRLFAPNLSYVDLAAPGYYFLATDTPEVLRWLAARAEQAGAQIVCNASFRTARRRQSGFELDDGTRTRYLVGADGPNSQVARVLGLGLNTKYLFGVEYEFSDTQIEAPHMLHCFIDRRLARGYIGWIVAGIGVVQVGLASRVRNKPPPPKAVMSEFLDKIAPIADFRAKRLDSIRAGMIPCGGIVSPVAARRALLVGDAAGMVSPVTAGGIHTALKHGLAAGHAIADYLCGKRDDPCGWFVRTYPRFRLKRLLRFLFDNFQSDAAFNLLLRTKVMRSAAGVVYFHRRAVFDPDAGKMESETTSGGERLDVKVWRKPQ